MNSKFLLLFCLLQTFSLSYTRDQVQKTNIKDKALLQSNDILNLQEFKKSNSGIHYKVTKEGTGSKPYPGETVTVHYTGWLLEGDKLGAKFDSSKDRNQHFKFKLGQGMVIKGWELSLADMKTGETRIVILPADLAYGAHGAGNVIPPNATLVFEIELFDAK